MNSEALKDLNTKAQTYGHAYVRNLVVAEKAVLAGQFNAAKVLRAAAHAQRVLAMNATRLTSTSDATEVLETILHELDTGKTAPVVSSISPQEAQTKLDQFQVAENRLKEIISRALASLQENSDVLESDVDQFIWGCYNCGFLVEGDLPDTCPNCGALSIEFEWFGPFYSSTSEHLGQRTPEEILSILKEGPAQVDDLIRGIDDDLLSKRPSEEEWCIKEIVGHITEVERLFLQRVQTILENEGVPDLPSTAPPWLLQEGKGYEDWEASELLRQFRETRNSTLELLSSLEEKDWTRIGSNQGNPVSLLDLGTWLTNHDVGHIAQIRRYIPTNA